MYIQRLIAHLVVIVLVLVLAALVFLVIFVVVLHVVGGNLGVVNDLAACATTALDDVALIDGVTVGFLVILCRSVSKE